MRIRRTTGRTTGRTANATYVRHLRTLTGAGHGNDDVDLYRLDDGTEVEVISPASDCRKMPREVPADAPNYPGYAAGQ